MRVEVSVGPLHCAGAVKKRASLEVAAIDELVFFMSRCLYDDDKDNAHCSPSKVEHGEANTSRC